MPHTNSTWDQLREYAEARGGRLMTVLELKSYLKGKAKFPGEVAWVPATPNTLDKPTGMVKHEVTDKFIEMDEGFPLNLSDKN